MVGWVGSRERDRIGKGKWDGKRGARRIWGEKDMG